MIFTYVFLHTQLYDEPMASSDPLAELADLVLNVGRLIRARTPTGEDLVPLNETERTVMRLVDLHPGSTPTALARRAGLQRTNVSAAVTSLEGKGMVERRGSSDGRSVGLHPTTRSADNLQRLRQAWSTELGPALSDDLADVERCTALLARLELRLSATDEPD